MEIQNIIEIYNILNSSGENQKELSEKKFNRNQNVIFVIMISLFVSSVILALLYKKVQFKYQREISLILVFLSQLLGVILNTHFIIGNIKQLMKPLENFLKNLTKSVMNDKYIFENLLNKKIEDLYYVKDSIIFEKDQIEKRSKVFGSLDFLGIIPSIIGLYGALNKIKFADVILYIIVGIYLSMFYIKLTISAIEKKLFIIEQVIKSHNDTIKNE